MKTFEQIKAKCEFTNGNYCWSNKRTKGVMLCEEKECPKTKRKVKK